MPKPKASSSRKAQRRDKVARWVITLGGVAVIASVAAILALIVGVTLPLFQNPRATVVSKCRLPATLDSANIVRLGIDLALDRSAGTAFLITKNGVVVLVDLGTGNVLSREQLSPAAVTPPDSSLQPTSAQPRETAKTLWQAEPLGAGRYALVWSDGSVSILEIVADATRHEPDRPRYTIRTVASLPARLPDDQGADATSSSAAETAPRQVVVRRAEGGATTRVALLSDGRISVLRQAVTENLLGDQEVTNHQATWREDALAGIRVLTMDHDGNTLYAGTDDGCLGRWQLNERGEVAQREVVRAFTDKRAITALAMVLGDVSLAVGDSRGEITTWFPVRTEGVQKLRVAHRLAPHSSPIREILPSGRSKSLFSLDDGGTIHVDHMTSERQLLSVDRGAGPSICQVALGARGDGLLALDAAGALTAWRIEGGCPEISLKTLFGKVLYEGYHTPEYVWQTTGGADFEPKFSLVPLIFGTLKGTFYAMLFAVPLALFGAAYTSYFAAPALRRMIKPVVEIMATVPSVVIGFLIALWLAPIIANSILAFFISLAIIPATFVAFLALWQLVARFPWAKRIENGYEFLLLFPVLLLGIGLAVWLAGPMEAWLFGGNFRHWLFAGPLGISYDQRNSIIIAFGLGFTVIPVIFSIAEDALSNVPYNMTAASLALGASRWQTLWRVILPSASPGIFAAMMIGFGRAVGETMIVLMATGNTPLLDWSPLNGMRTLSANIAVEISEAPVGGTLYRVLFLCAVLLFLLTFTVNTVAELVRQHLRKRYARF